LKSSRQRLLGKPTCPNCWKSFATETVKWISGHEDLIGDERLGDDAQIRFTPTLFDSQCNAVDVKGISCQELACPHCHLKIPRSVLESPSFFVSIVGTPSCGKSYLLASMAWQNRRTLPEIFQLSFSDADTQCNELINSYQERLFFSSEPGKLVQLPKTDVTGDNYSTVQYEDQSVTYPNPLFFDVSQLDATDEWARLLCLYDNAGESFLPGADSLAAPVTKHLGLADGWIFCFDPTQDPRFRAELAGESTDHQIAESPVTARQDLVLTEMINRIRKFSNMGLKEQSKKPLVIACTKFDAWSKLLGPLSDPWRYSKSIERNVLDLSEIDRVSAALKKILQKFCPEITLAAEAISKRVYYVPVSATGTSPVKDPASGDFKIPVNKIKPIWCEVPLLLTFAFRCPKLVPAARGGRRSKATEKANNSEAG